MSCISTYLNNLHDQYKLPHIDWEKADEVAVNGDAILVADVVDLEPGTAYFVRFVVVESSSGNRTFGPETVFDTKPIDCTPKKKKCVIS